MDKFNYSKRVLRTEENISHSQKRGMEAGGGVCSRSHVPRAACLTRRQLLHIKKNVKHPTEETGKRNHFHKNASEWPWKTYARLRGS